MANIVLASASPRRKELLEVICADFTVAPADIDETICPSQTLEQNIERLAREKALACRAQHAQAFCIGADTIVTLGEKALGKPKDTAAAADMLRTLSGNTHVVLTGLAVVAPSGAMESQVVATKVRFRNLADAEITRYIQTGEPMDKAGAYGIQGRGGVFVEHIEGDYFSVVGLPIAPLYEMLTRMGALTQEGGASCGCDAKR